MRRLLGLVLVAALVGCNNNTPSNGDGAAPRDFAVAVADLTSVGDAARARDFAVRDLADLSAPDLLMVDLAGYCGSDADCNGRHCLVANHVCVDCVSSGDCGAGQVCNPGTHTCVLGCSAQSPCPADGGVCELDAGACVACLVDGDCPAAAPRCDPSTHLCNACLPTNDNCPRGDYCATQGNNHVCLSGCKNDGDCQSGNYCNPVNRQCVLCLNDAQCPTNEICLGNVCVAGCSATHGCGFGQACCSMQCTDESSDTRNCGGCGSVCGSGQSCCGGNCSDPMTDPNNCGGCGTVCVVRNGTATCVGGTCAIGSCNTGYADCDHSYMNGCETQTSADTSNCGSCNHVCAEQNATAACNNGQCAIASCNMPWLDCDGNPANGCEVNGSSDANNCGACSHVCSVPNGTAACSGGVCGISCPTGTADCNGTLSCSTNVATDPMNCGGCGIVCSSNNMQTVTCANGMCNGACIAGYYDCNNNLQKDGCESYVASDPNNCGGCGMACSMTNVLVPACQFGNCASECQAGYMDCTGNLRANGCEANITSDVRNCGGCGIACSTLNATPSCNNSTCGGTCKQGWANCNSNIGTAGCPVNVATDVNNCGGCHKQCSSYGIQTVMCGNGVCNGACLAGYADCNNNKQTDGCETQTSSDVNNCGGCGQACSTNNIARVCSGGSCEGGFCLNGYLNCDSPSTKRQNGCNVNIQSDPFNCGMCGVVCSSNNIAVPTCGSGVCNGACNMGWGDCNNNKQMDGCETNLLSDPTNCGNCGFVCTVAGTTCINGVCACPAPFTLCGGRCVNTQTDPNHCGGCPNACSGVNIATPTCTAGICTGACNPGTADCNNNKLTDGCETTVSGGDPNNCGGCFMACSKNNIIPACSNSSCEAGTCQVGYANCNMTKRQNGCNVNTQIDPNNCGGCGTICSNVNINTPMCSSGVCSGICNTGYANCNNTLQANGCNINLMTDNNNCGSCGHTCGSGLTCQGGVCSCPIAGQSFCAGSCVDTTSNVSDCGGCGKACSSQGITTVTCSGGVCNGMCAPGYADCDMNKQTDGCEVNTLTDKLNCGGCGMKCSTNNIVAACANGSCEAGTCQVGWANCDTTKRMNGCNVNTQTDPNNCGACGTVCSALNDTPSCGNGACNSICSAGYANCDNTLQANGCNIDTLTDSNNCGGCGKVCPNGTACMNGSCQCLNGGTNCNGRCVNLANDPLNCGGCGVACSPFGMSTVTCTAGVCNGTCLTGYADCDNNKQTDGCEINTTNNANNCGACGTVCSNVNDAPQCTGSVCTSPCNAGYANCTNTLATNGCNDNIFTDLSNCGGCGMPCSTNNLNSPACSNGTCYGICANGYADCDNNLRKNGCEVNILTDNNNCGKCGTVCPSGTSCVNGACQCSPGVLYCSGACTNVTNNINDCGGCGLVCSSNNMASVTCTSSTCNGACQVGYADCDNNKQTNGCETNIYTSPNNCGACGAACSTNHITAGCTAPGNCSGTCQSGYRDCDNNLRTNGCEIDIMTDPNNCGGCSGGGTWPYVCSGTNAQSRTCTNGVCTTTCLAGYGNCDNSLSQNGCNVYFVNNPNYCGSCSLQCDTSVDPNTGMPIQKCVVNKCLLTNGQPCFVGSSCVSGICSQGLCSPF